MEQTQKQRLDDAESDFARIPGWNLINLEEQKNLLGELQRHAIHPTPDITGLRNLINAQTDITNTLRIKKKIIKQTKKNSGGGSLKPTKILNVPARITSEVELESLVVHLEAAKEALDQFDLKSLLIRELKWPLIPLQGTDS